MIDKFDRYVFQILFNMQAGITSRINNINVSLEPEKTSTLQGIEARTSGVQAHVLGSVRCTQSLETK
jgi:hypothetical protein